MGFVILNHGQVRSSSNPSPNHHSTSTASLEASIGLASITFLQLGSSWALQHFSGMVRASDSRLEGLGSMPDATKYPSSTRGVRDR
ncbi:hypothetical protein TNCV_668641 [Trichonephila clavipes]|nr:hypothetical protein TNCV_668641 [Trichonephila clavipes]